MDQQQTEQSGRGRGNPAWVPGVSGNPAGRPRGSRNKATLLVEQMMGDRSGKVAQAAIALAETGHIPALRLCLARLCPPMRERAADFDMPPIETLSDAARAYTALLQAAAAGDLLPSQAGELGRLVDGASRVLQAMEAQRTPSATDQPAAAA